jgi:hypothetical protein
VFLINFLYYVTVSHIKNVIVDVKFDRDMNHSFVDGPYQRND